MYVKLLTVAGLVGLFFFTTVASTGPLGLGAAGAGAAAGAAGAEGAAGADEGAGGASALAGAGATPVTFT